MMFDPPPYKTLEELRKQHKYMNTTVWHLYLSSLTKNLEECWLNFKNKNTSKYELFLLAEMEIGEPPTRDKIIKDNLYPVEEYYYNSMYVYYFNLYEKFKELAFVNDRLLFNLFKSKLAGFYMTTEEIRACIEYYLQNGRYKNTLLALKTINRFAKYHAIRVQDVEVVFREWITG
jgi:hypothetical protein